MAFEISYIEAHKIVVLRYEGDTEISEHTEGRSKLINLCTEKNRNKALVILGFNSAEGEFTYEELKSFGENIVNESFGDIVFAVVLPESIPDQNKMYFPVYIMKERGINLRTFYNSYDAIEWLSNYQ